MDGKLFLKDRLSTVPTQPGGIGGAALPPGTAARKMPGTAAVRLRERGTEIEGGGNIYMYMCFVLLIV